MAGRPDDGGATNKRPSHCDMSHLGERSLQAGGAALLSVTATNGLQTPSLQLLKCSWTLKRGKEEATLEISHRNVTISKFCRVCVMFKIVVYFTGK